MANDNTAIEWCDATWGPITGCSRVSEGCRFCYAEALSHRWKHTTKPWTLENARENVIVHPDRFEIPLHWRRPRRIFVNSMSDLHHELVPDDVLDELYEVMRVACHHTFIVLTKRPQSLARYVRKRYTEGAPVPPNIWLGVSVEEDRWASRVDILRDLPCRVRFVSAEPLLAPLPSLSLAGIHWLIVGGESGPGPSERKLVRPAMGGGLEPKDWALGEVRRLRDLAVGAGTAFFFKQWGGRTPKAGGRALDGRIWAEFPEALPGGAVGILDESPLTPRS